MYRFKKGSGFPVSVPSVDLVEIGAGGGSLARVDQFGLLKVGPESAGAEPGPACYGQGGTAPAVTDADLLLGLLDAESFLGGAMPLDASLAEESAARVAESLGMMTIETAACPPSSMPTALQEARPTTFPTWRPTPLAYSTIWVWLTHTWSDSPSGEWWPR